MKTEHSESLGVIADNVDNLLGARELSMPAEFHLEQLKGILPSMRDRLRQIVFEATGENPWVGIWRPEDPAEEDGK